MKHAGTETLDSVEDLLQSLRTFPQLVEKKRGTFYKKSSAFLHFHEDPAGIFADVKSEGDFQRFEANTPAQKKTILAFVRKILS